MKYLTYLIMFFSLMSFAQKPCGFKKDLQEGTCKKFYNNGQVKEIVNWEKGKIEGESVFYHENGAIKAKGLYKNNFKIKDWLYYDKNSILTGKEIYKNGNEFLSIYYDSEGIITHKASFIEDKQHGEYISYYPKTTTIETFGYYDKGMSVGTWKLYYPSGKIQRETEFVNDQWNGKRVHYFENGNIEKTEIYKNGKLISTKK